MSQRIAHFCQVQQESNWCRQNVCLVEHRNFFFFFFNKHQSGKRFCQTTNRRDSNSNFFFQSDQSDSQSLRMKNLETRRGGEGGEDVFEIQSFSNIKGPKDRYQVESNWIDHCSRKNSNELEREKIREEGGGKKREKKNSLCHHPYSRLILIRFDACQSGTSLNSREFRRVKKKILSPYTFLEIEIEIEMETRRKKN